MNIKELIERNTNEEGVVDYDAVQNEINADTQKQIGAVASKQKNKAKAKVEEVKQEVETVNTEADEKYSAMQEQLAEMQEYFNTQKKQKFASEAKKNGFTDEQISALDGIDYDTFNFDVFKQEAPKDISTKNENEDVESDISKATEDDDIQNYLKMMRGKRN